ncbi:hypothetical protein PR048_029128 [Dryococelus australis]|uniref:Uncharacterized protein n=1 Tax=Dryococelus australis TaxID=614101 RepID=A0ABQ9GF15_9NEOP|nr:hypothetical protein PR048_029128 [Dryococelus australis]
MEKSLADRVKLLETSGFCLTQKEFRLPSYPYALKRDIEVPHSWKKNKMAGKDWCLGFCRQNCLSLIKPEGTVCLRQEQLVSTKRLLQAIEDFRFAASDTFIFHCQAKDTNKSNEVQNEERIQAHQTMPNTSQAPANVISGDISSRCSPSPEKTAKKDLKLSAKQPQPTCSKRNSSVAKVKNAKRSIALSSSSEADNVSYSNTDDYKCGFCGVSYYSKSSSAGVVMAHGPCGLPRSLLPMEVKMATKWLPCLLPKMAMTSAELVPGLSARLPPRRTVFDSRRGRSQTFALGIVPDGALIGGLSRGSPISPAPAFRHCSIFTFVEGKWDFGTSGSGIGNRSCSCSCHSDPRQPFSPQNYRADWCVLEALPPPMPRIVSLYLYQHYGKINPLPIPVLKIYNRSCACGGSFYKGKGSDLTELQKGMISAFGPRGAAMYVNSSHASVVKVYSEWTNGTIGIIIVETAELHAQFMSRGEHRRRWCVKVN